MYSSAASNRRCAWERIATDAPPRRTTSGPNTPNSEARARLGAVLPRSTVVSALNRATLPREGLLVAYLRVCGCDEAEVAGWLDARRRLACG